jgi:lysozyme
MSKAKIGIATAAAVALSIGIIKPWEGVETTTYLDIVGVPTVCYGQTGQAARIGATYTNAECEAMLGAEVAEVARGLDRCVRVDLEPHQAAPVISLGYNVGVRAVCNSTMVALINAGEPPEVWCRQFDRWVYAGGRRVQGLVNRRAYERAVCEGRRQP